MYFKPNGSTLRWIGPTDECTIWNEKKDHVNEYHPTQKPISLPSRAIKNHSASTILDCFLGAGGSLIAAHQLSRRCFGIEIHPPYVAVTLQRFKDTFSIEPKLIT
jgi:DNA modification methylase